MPIHYFLVFHLYLSTASCLRYFEVETTFLFNIWTDSCKIYLAVIRALKNTAIHALSAINNAALIPFTKLNNVFVKSQVIWFCWFTTGNPASKTQMNIFWLLHCRSKHHLQYPFICKLFSRGRFTLALTHIYNGPLIIIVNNAPGLTNSVTRAIPVKSVGCAPDLGLFQTLSTCWLHSCHIL